MKEGNKLGNALIKAYPDILKEMQNMKVDDYIVSESFVTKVNSGFEKKTLSDVEILNVETLEDVKAVAARIKEKAEEQA